MEEVFTELGFIEIPNGLELRDAVISRIEEIEEVRKELEKLCMEKWNAYLNSKWLNRLFRQNYAFATFREMWDADVLNMFDSVDSSYDYSATVEVFEKEYELLTKAKNGLYKATSTVWIKLELFDVVNRNYSIVIEE